MRCNKVGKIKQQNNFTVAMGKGIFQSSKIKMIVTKSILHLKKSYSKFER